MALLGGCTPSGTSAPPADAKRPVASAPTPNPAAAREFTGEGVIALRRLLQRYSLIRTYAATGAVQFVFDEESKTGVKMERLFLFEQPNRYRAVNISGNLKSTSISDGKKTLEFTNTVGTLYHAPATLAEASAVMISNENYCGSLLFDFFSGESRLDELVAEGSNEIGLKNAENPEQQVITFEARAPFGNVKIAYSTKDLVIQSIEAGMEPNEAVPSPDLAGSVREMTMIERFSNIKIDEPIDPTAFSTKAPAGVKVGDTTKSSLVDAPAPLFDLKDTDGTVHSLRALRNQVVVLLFVHSGSPTSRTALTSAQRALRPYRDEVALLVVSNESRELLKIFKDEVSLESPLLVDEKSGVFQAYGVISERESSNLDVKGALMVPQAVVIDRRGRVAENLDIQFDQEAFVGAVRRAGAGRPKPEDTPNP